MYKLALAPDQNGYAAAEGYRHVYQKLDGGAGRQRKDILNGTYKVDVTWTVTKDDYLYLTTFHRATKEGTEPFRMDLLLTKHELVEYECRLIPGTWRLTSVKGETYVVKAQLEVVPDLGDDAFDEGLVTTYEAFGPEGAEAFADLAYLVNVLMPANIR